MIPQDEKKKRGGASMTNESTRATAAPDDRPCADQMRASGLPAPRTCPTCKLGPCKFALPSPSTRGEPATDSAGMETDSILGSLLDDFRRATCDQSRPWAETELYAARKALFARIEHLFAARGPAPVARELDVDAERQAFLLKSARIKAFDAWVADFPKQRGRELTANECRIAFIAWTESPSMESQSTADSAPASAAPFDKGPWRHIQEKDTATTYKDIVESYDLRTTFGFT